MRTSIVGLLTTVLLAAVVLAGCGGSEQMAADDPEPVVLDDQIDTEPQIVGGMERVYEITRYPERARQDGVTGTIWVRCVVTVRGNATRLRIAEGGDRRLEAAALDVVEQLAFTPGKIDRGPVPTSIEIPVVFPPPQPSPEE